MIAIVGIHYKDYTHILYRSYLPIYGVAIITSLSFLFLDDLEAKANISVAIKSGSTVSQLYHPNRKFAINLSFPDLRSRHNSLVNNIQDIG